MGNLKIRSSLSIILISTLVLVSPLSRAQSTDPLQSEVRSSGPRQQLATIIFSGLGGAVLGLSTLSFYGRPQDHLNNIAIGFAVGVIGGTIFTTYRTAQRPYEARWHDRFESPATEPIATEPTPTEPTPTPVGHQFFSWNWHW